MTLASRTYRLAAAFLAVMLLFSGSLPLIQHACAMAMMHDMEMPEHCPMDQEAEVPAETDAPHAEEPCHSEVPAQLPSSTQVTCCVDMAANSMLDEGILVKTTSKNLVLVASVAFLADVPSQRSPQTHRLAFDTGPPSPSSAPLYLLHAVLLN